MGNKNETEVKNEKKGCNKSNQQQREPFLVKRHKDTLFRGLFIIPENFMYLLKKCSGGQTQLTKDDIVPFDLSTTYTKRQRWNDVSFLTKDDKLIIFVEHQLC